MSKFNDDFDYENAERDIWDAGGDPDYLNYMNPDERDAFMHKMGMDPKDYGSKWEDFDTSCEDNDLLSDFDILNHDFESDGHDEWDTSGSSYHSGSSSLNYRTKNTSGFANDSPDTNSRNDTMQSKKMDKTASVFAYVVVFGIVILISGILLYACGKVALSPEGTGTFLGLFIFGVIAFAILIFIIIQAFKKK